MSRKKGPRPRQQEENQEPQWGFTGLTQVKGVSPEVAYGEVVNNLVDDPLALAIITKILEDPEGQELMRGSAQQWIDLGFPPPWEKAQEILSKREAKE